MFRDQPVGLSPTFILFLGVVAVAFRQFVKYPRTPLSLAIGLRIFAIGHPHAKLAASLRASANPILLTSSN